MKQGICQICKREFTISRSRRKYCSEKCRRQAKREYYREYAKLGTKTKREKKKEYIETGTLCWTCQNATCGCSWSRSFIPVDGWVAKPTRIRLTLSKTIDSFDVKECPQYIADTK